MLRQAVDRHERKLNKLVTDANTNAGLGSSPVNQQSTIARSSQANVLKPASASAVNAQRTAPSRVSPVHGVKRKISDLAQAVNPAFEEEGDVIWVKSQTRGTTETSNSGTAKASDFIFDENEFDSDIDLDVEEPKKSVTYPTLPAQNVNSAATSIPKPVVYPTLPRQQAVQAVYRAGDDFPPPISSGLVDWSSSPPEHFQPRFKPASLNAKLDQKPHETKPLRPTASGPRSLPWAATEESADPPITPAIKQVKKTVDIWNSTPGAVKTQLKRHREEKEAQKLAKTAPQPESVVQKATSKNKRPAKVFLSDEQQHVLDLVVKKSQSVFFTGSAGTGKSVLLRQIIAELRALHKKEPDRIAVTASTGLAACNIGGVTLHSFSGIGLGKEDVPELLRKIRRNTKAKQRWLRTKVLVIDEVSMVDGELFDKLEQLARQIRNNGRPFGGIQLVITGDFFQLPPVPERNGVAKFSFDASTWNTTIHHTICLHQVFRQKDPGKIIFNASSDAATDLYIVFAGMLNEMREGRLSQTSIQSFQQLSRELDFKDAIGATELFPLRAEVDKANEHRLKMLQGRSYTFEARDGGTATDKLARDRLLQNCMAPETITLKKGAQVMLIKNIDELLVNGSIGRVIAFMSEDKFDKVSIDDDLYMQQEQEELAQTDGMSKTELARKRLQDNTSSSTSVREYPLVRFSVPDGTSRDMLCQPESWKVELPNGEVQASRSQVPLILSWALSIHKAQGQTLERVKVDLGRVFEKGQAYVALSRATSMAGLQVLRFDPKKVLAHDRVRSFYSNLARVQVTSSKANDRKPQPTGSEYEKRFQAGDDEF